MGSEVKVVYFPGTVTVDGQEVQGVARIQRERVPIEPEKKVLISDLFYGDPFRPLECIIDPRSLIFTEEQSAWLKENYSLAGYRDSYWLLPEDRTYLWSVVPLVIVISILTVIAVVTA